AVNGSVVPFAMLEPAGVSTIDCSTAGVTVNTVVPVTGPNLALRDVTPAARAVASPLGETLATAGVAVVQATRPVRSCVELSEKVPMAVICWFFPTAMLGFAGVNATD